MRALVYGDVHLDTGAVSHPYERPDLDPAEWDAVVTLGDVVHRTREDFEDPADGDPYERRGRALFEHLDATGVPVLAVPGNHDPLDATRRLVSGLENVVVAHRRTVTADDVAAASDWDGVRFAAVGCEAFDQGPELDYLNVPSLDPRTDADGAGTVHERATAVGERIESAVGAYLSGTRTADEAADSLDPAPGDRQTVVSQLEALAARFRTWRDLLAGDGPTVALSHVSPFGVAFDSHHGDDDWSRYPTGSIALKMALYDATPLAALSGHTHVRGTDVVQGAAQTTYAYNPGQNVVAVTLRPGTGQVRPEVPSL
ncbi:MAG: metallophosphoesterase [Haloferacaceae archaeon]